ncbi:hypothetical protein L208DRAFT_1413292 [Tricholoma matsutake]|nr:hypothetical protein L208DRAFT_1413292 [Tricholoma matsutake 945]
MKFSRSLVFFVTGAAFTIPSTLADFHITIVATHALEAIPSPHFTCSDIKSSSVTIGSPSLLSSSAFSIPPGLCGFEGQLNVYKQPGNIWFTYINDTTELVATCYPNLVNGECRGTYHFQLEDKLVCYSAIC